MRSTGYRAQGALPSDYASEMPPPPWAPKAAMLAAADGMERFPGSTISSTQFSLSPSSSAHPAGLPAHTGSTPPGRAAAERKLRLCTIDLTGDPKLHVQVRVTPHARAPGVEGHADAAVVPCLL